MASSERGGAQPSRGARPERGDAQPSRGAETTRPPIVRWIARAVCRVFYRVDRVGHVPTDGAAILLPNHPNALLDPAVVWATAGRDVRFLAKSTLFEGPLRPILAGAGAIPVYRRIDQGADTSRNVEMFAAVAAALTSGDAICIFPEGISHSSGRLETLRTGAARMAIDAERHGVRVALVPVGLNFDRKTMFRSRVVVVYGPAFSAQDLVPAKSEADSRAFRELTDRIAEHMRSLLIEADPDADAALIERVDRLYAAARGRPPDPAERVTRRRAIATGLERLRADASERYDAILLRLRRYDQRLRRFGLQDRHLDWKVSSTDAIRFAVRELFAAVVLLPLCVIGFTVFFVPYQLTGVVARLFTRERDVIATAQVFTGAAIYAVWLAILSAIAWTLGGPLSGLLTIAVVPPIAVTSLFAIERETAVVETVRAWFLLRRAQDDTWQRLRRRRSELADVLDEVYEWLREENRV
jgi:glycerol-3-phosphate O-acyltransferase / dihydroxyacetone phosphate acyltransferase